MCWDFRILGPVEALVEQRPVSLGGSKPLIVLAGLLLRANRLVTVDQLAEWLWADRQPRNTRAAIQNYVARTRRALGNDDLVRTERSGYRAVLDDEQLDLMRCDRLVLQARAEVADDRVDAAVRHLGDALAEWRGAPLSNVESELLLRDELPALDEKWLHIKQLWVDAMLASGRHAEIIAEVSALAGEHPLAERLHQQLMLALYRDGRKAQALDVYRTLHTTLADELGLDPGEQLQRLHQQILTGDPALDVKPIAAQRIAPANVNMPPAPRQLPADIAAFTGRTAELARLRALTGRDAGGTLTVAAIEGTAGAGKSALAVHFGHEIAHRFPDGQLFVNLRGYGPGEPLAPATVLASLLQVLGVAGDQIPAELDDRAAMWRTHTTDRALLVILDNARDTEQVRSLLPGAGCLVLVTSRAQLRGLAARDGAIRVPVGEFVEADALTLLTGTLGTQRIQADPAATGRFLDRCAMLPLAIRILAERASMQPDTPLAEFLDDMDTETGLSAFDLDDDESTDLGAVFAYSYRALDAESARLFRLLGLHQGPELSVLAAAALAGLPVPKTRRLLDRLARANLIGCPRHGRYQFHDLLREFAADRATTDEPESERTKAITRMLDFYLHAMLRARKLFQPYNTAELVEPPELSLPIFTDYRTAADWMSAEHSNASAIIELARKSGNLSYVCEAGSALLAYFIAMGVQDGWFATCDTVVKAARASGDKASEARALNARGAAMGTFGSAQIAIDGFRQALELNREIGDTSSESTNLVNLSITCRKLAQYDDATDYARMALAAAEQTSSEIRIGMAHNTLAEALVGAGMFDTALRHSAIAMRIFSTSDHPPELADAFDVNAAALAGLRQYREAVQDGLRALEIFRQIDRRLDQAEVLERLSDYYVKIDNIAEAVRCQRNAVDIFAAVGHGSTEQATAKLAELEAMTARR